MNSVYPDNILWGAVRLLRKNWNPLVEWSGCGK